VGSINLLGQKLQGNKRRQRACTRAEEMGVKKKRPTEAKEEEEEEEGE
jgi:hypothetical protein